MKNFNIGLAAIVLLSGCATASHDDAMLANEVATPLSSDVYPVESIIQKMSTEPNYYFSAQLYGTTMQADMFALKSGETEFEHQQVRYTEMKSTMTYDDIPVASMLATLYYDINPYRYLGINNHNGTLSIAVENTPLPKYASVGSQGVYATEIVYKDLSKQEQVAKNVFNWALIEGNADTALLCEIVESDAISVDYDESYKGCYEINKAGDILGGFLEIPDPTQDMYDDGLTPQDPVDQDLIDSIRLDLTVY